MARTFETAQAVLAPEVHAPPPATDKLENLADGTVLIAGGGPVGLLLATVLAHFGVKSVLLERNKTTTKWPKMDLTNGRSMEILRRLGLADGLRSQGVSSECPYTVLFSSGLGRKKAITSWDLHSVDEWRKITKERNDGTLPLEPYQRISQAIFERWLKEHADANPMIDVRFGVKVESVSESDSGALTTVTDVDTGARKIISSKYVGACDGASSKVRTSLSIPLDGGPTPGFVLLVHFKSTDLSRIRKQGQFWHLFFLVGGHMGGALIAQNEIDTWTVHMFLPLDADPDKIDSHEAVYTVLGGLGEKYRITIDEILVRSTFRPNVAVARSYISPKGHAYLAGDSAHQNIPTGGYGMNMGIADAWDLGWKLAAVINGHGGPSLLASYEADRRPVAFISVERSKVHMGVHGGVAEVLAASGDYNLIDSPDAAGDELRAKLQAHYQAHDGENKNHGVEMGFRYESGVIVPDQGAVPPVFAPERYVPSTYPGTRAPHVFLSDGSAIFDHFGKDYTLVEFAQEEDAGAGLVVQAAREARVPLEHVVLSGEENARSIWEKTLVLVRPDGHVSWRADKIEDAELARRIVAVVSGKETWGEMKKQEAFGVSGSDEVMTQTSDFSLEKQGDFQK